ncbi:MAG: ABC transporter ATP-binding protein [Thermoprotei archaeon]|nr:MAG: ABC transporter ATP-binding protein [Thermoprotei archaeon]
MPTVELKNVSKKYGEITALSGVSLRIEDGEYACIIGPSGSGKSTLLKLIAGVIQPDSGEIYIDGRLVNDLSVRRRNIGIVMQDILLFPHMNLWDNVTYGPLVKTASYRRAESTGMRILVEMGLTLRRDALPSELSRGMQQKVAIARALAAGARLLLLDEPFGSIDPRASKNLRVELRKLVKDLGLTVIHVTHNQEEAMSVADKIIVLRKGRVEQVGTPVELYMKPKTPFIARFIGGETNFLEANVTSVEKGYVHVQAREMEVQLPYRGSVTKGERVVLTIRPEYITISPFKPESGENVFEGTIERVYFLGPFLRIIVKVGGVRLIAKVPRMAVQPKVGNKVYVKILMAHLFNYPEEGLEKAIAYE